MRKKFIGTKCAHAEFTMTEVIELTSPRVELVGLQFFAAALFASSFWSISRKNNLLSSAF